MLSADYQRAVQLLLRLVPIVFASDVFALKGGTAINLFMSPVSRLSVDLDLAFLPLGLPRAEALAEISRELEGVRERAEASSLTTRAPRRVSGDESQVLVSDGQTEVKIEVNQVFRGSVLPTHMARLHPTAEELFATHVAARLLANAEVYAGKAVAALDRQHPRDLFDVWIRYHDGGYSSSDLDVFAVYLAGHNRPPHEILTDRDRPLADLYVASLVGMTSGNTPSVEELDATRRQFRLDVLRRMSSQAREFLTSFFALDPAWDALPFSGLEQLPALQWKQRNLEVFRARRPHDFAAHYEALDRLLH
jgi:hypothetical protein